LIDTHAHIDTEAFDADRAEMLGRAWSEGIQSIIIPAIKPDAFDNMLQVAESDDRIFFGIGVHPHHSAEISDSALDRVSILSSHKKCVAIGEIGLDYYYDFSPKSTQQKVFSDHLELAKRSDKPVIIHNREADDDIISILKEHQDGTLKGVLHCFSGDVETLEQALGLGFNVSFTGNITFKKTDLVEQVRNTPMESLLLETDSPYMTPAPHRGKRNEPSMVGLVAQKIAEIKNISLEEVRKMTNENAKRLFRILIILAFTVLSINPVLAQASIDDEDLEYEEEDLHSQYRKYIGIFPLMGFNTIVFTYYLPGDKEKEVSNEGIPAYGASVAAGLLDFMVLEFTYLYSKNTKTAEEWIDDNGNYTINPNYHYFYEFTTHWIANPSGRIGIYGSVGYSVIHNMYGVSLNDTTNPSGYLEGTNSGINAGLGIYIHIPTSFGMIVPSFSWKLNFELGNSTTKLYEKLNGEQVVTDTEVSSFFSIPRVQLIWFMPFIKW